MIEAGPSDRFDRLGQVLFEPTRAQRLAAGLLLAACLANLFYHGQQPYAVGLFRAPWDKLAHLTMFFGTSVLLWVIFAARHGRAIVLSIALIGLLDEFAQSFNPGRSVDLSDWIVDVSASVLAVLCLRWLRARLRAGRAAAAG
ncbi:MAG: VanZ family protein [Burkholderiaceae bacterium]